MAAKIRTADPEGPILTCLPTAMPLGLSARTIELLGKVEPDGDGFVYKFPDRPAAPGYSRLGVESAAQQLARLFQGEEPDDGGAALRRRFARSRLSRAMAERGPDLPVVTWSRREPLRLLAFDAWALGTLAGLALGAALWVW